MKNKLYLLLLLLLSSFVFAQLSDKQIQQKLVKVDSFLKGNVMVDSASLYLNQIEKTANWSSESSLESEFLYRKIRLLMLRGNYQEVVPLAKKAIVFYERQDQKAKAASCKKFLGHSYFQINQKKLALHYLNEAEADIDESERATLYYYLSAFYLSINDNRSAQKYAIDGFELAKKQENVNQLIEGYSALAFVNTKQKNIKKAIDYYQKAMELSKQKKRNYHILIASNNLGAILLEDGQYTEALRIFFDAKDRVRIIKNDHLNAILDLNIAETYAHLNAVVESEKYAQLCYQYAQKTKDQLLLSEVLLVLGDLSFKENNYAKAIANYQEVVQHATAIEEDKLKAKGYLNLSKTYEKINQSDLALSNFKEHIAINEAIAVKEKKRETEELQIKYDISQYQQELELLQIKSTQSKYRYALLVLLIVGLSYFVIRQHKTIKIKKRNEKYLEEISRLKEENLNKEVEFKNRQVTEFALQIQEQNKLLSNFKKKLTTVKSASTDSAILDEIKELQLMINDSIDLNNEKVQLNSQIKDSQASFLFNLKNSFPDLNDKEIQIATYLRLNLNTKQISSQLNISEKAINNYRAIIRKKLNLEKDQNLTSFLKEI